MALSVSVGLSKKVGLPAYGSLGASCHVEFELDGGFPPDNHEAFLAQVRQAYAACTQAVEEQLAQPPALSAAAALPTGPVNGVEHANGHANGYRRHAGTGQYRGNGSGGPRPATVNQLRALHAIAGRQGVDLVGLLQERFGLEQPEALSIRAASQLIEELQSAGAGNQRWRGRPATAAA